MSRLAGSLGVALVVLLIFGALEVAHAYKGKQHGRSVKQGAAKYQAGHGTAIDRADLHEMVEGVEEPDDYSLGHAQIVMQRFEPGAYGKQRNVSIPRIAAQSFHASPNPTRPPYGDSGEDQEKKKQAIPVAAAELLPDRFELDVWAYFTNEQVRNRMLINASQWLCVSLAHRDDAQSARKLGNLFHMIGDSYSASHVQRSEPVRSADNCGTEKIEWHFSMDLVSWELHEAADKETGDWRFRCLVEHVSDLIKLWVEGREAVRVETDGARKLQRANERVRQSLGLLCDRVLREDPEVLRRPAGGAAAGYSIASGFKKKGPDRPIQPVGLTGAAEAEAFVKTVGDSVRAEGGPAHFWYPPRDMGDLCTALEQQDELPAALQCTPQEIDWAMSGSAEVETLWIPPRTQP